MVTDMEKRTPTSSLVGVRFSVSQSNIPTTCEAWAYNPLSTGYTEAR